MLLQASLSHYKAEPENQDLVAQQIQARHQTETQRIGVNLSYPLILTQSRNLTVNGGIYAVRNASRYTRSVPAAVPVIELSSDIRALSVELNSTEATDDSATQWSIGLYQGFDAAGAKQLNSDIDLDFTRIKGSFVQSNQFTGGYGITLKGSGQYSNSILPLSEQIGFGANLFGLAYPAGEIAGDKGWGVSLEFNRSFALDSTYFKQIQPYILGDAAKVYANGGNLLHSEIASLGIGVRFTDQLHYSLDLSIAQPVGEIPVNASNRSPRLNLSYAYQFE
jgi:hemolysin activation/secretion protein